MDLYGKLNQINYASDRVRARQERREARRQLYANIGEAVGQTATREAAMQWALHSQDASDSPGILIGQNHPGPVAMLAVRKAFSQYHIPAEYELRWIGLTRAAGSGQHRVDEGVITIEATLHSVSGIDKTVDVPVMVRNGRVLEPVVINAQGHYLPMTQDTFDSLLKSATFMAEVPSRQNMFSPPPEERRPPQQVPLVRPGMFGLAPVNRMMTASYIRSALTGVSSGLPPFQAMRDATHDHIDRAEQPPASRYPGDDVTLKRAVDVLGRDGHRWSLKAGTRGQIQRDMEGDDRYYYVFFPEMGWSARISAEALR